VSYTLFPDMGGLLFLLRSDRLTKDDLDFGIFTFSSTRSHARVQRELIALLPQLEAEGRVFYEVRTYEQLNEVFVSLGFPPVLGKQWEKFTDLDRMLRESGIPIAMKLGV
jgi:hypothetical protein